MSGGFNPDDFPGLGRRTKEPNSDVYVPDFVPLEAIQLDLEVELLEQYNRARKILHAAEYDLSVPLNQKAQALNAATAILAALTKSQAELFSLERVKKIEATLLTVLREFPELQAAFIPAYEAALSNVNV